MKPWGVALFAFLILSATTSDSLSYLLFKINQNYIAKNLCVNRDVEESTCNGSCYLSDKIEETKDVENSHAPLPASIETMPIVLIVQTAEDPVHSFPIEIPIPKGWDDKLESLDYIGSVFHPPQV